MGKKKWNVLMAKTMVASRREVTYLMYREPKKEKSASWGSQGRGPKNKGELIKRH